MYIPAAFSVNNPEQLHEFIRSHSFAILVSTGENSGAPPVATHLPLLLATANGSVRLIGHVAKGNSHWKIADGQKVLAIFSGPHAHISAGWYTEKNVVPTWNYVAVHVTGTLMIEQNPDRRMELLTEMVSFYESGATMPWRIDTVDSEYQQRMADSIVGFSIEIDAIEGCWKLNQHHPESRRTAVIEGLRERAEGDDLKIADLMESGAGS